MRVVTISVGGRPTKAVCRPGHDEPRRVVCGTLLTRPGRCPWCARVLTQAEYDAAIAAARETRSEAA